MKIGGHDRIEGLGLEYHTGCDCIHQHSVGCDPRIIMFKFLKNFIPEDHPMPLRIGFCDQG